MNTPASEYFRVILHRVGQRRLGDERIAHPDQEFPTRETADVWGAKKMTDPRYSWFEIERIVRPQFAAFVAETRMGSVHNENVNKGTRDG